MQMYLWRGPVPDDQRRRRRLDPLPRVHARALEPARHATPAGAGALNSRPGGRDGRGLERLVREGLPRRAVPRRSTRAAAGDVHMGVYTDATPELDPHAGARLPGRRVAAVCPGAAPPARAATRTATSARSSASRRCTPTARSGPRRCGTCARAIGSANAERLITQGMRLSPPEPSFLDERNAILAADAGRRRHVRRTRSGRSSPRRGMGYYASTTGSDDTSPVEDFSPPPAPGGPRGTIAGRVTDRAGAPLAGAKVALGSLVAQTDADGRYIARRACRRARTRT